MINFIKEQLIVWRLKRSFRIYTRPDRAFLKSIRTMFVIMAQQSRFGQNTHSDAKSRILDSDKAESGRAKHPLVWRYATMAIIAVLSMTSGMAVFAEKNDVSATSPLYPLKRLSEKVRLETSSPKQQLQLHEVFVQRRLKEITNLKTEEQPVSILTQPATAPGIIASKSREAPLTPRQLRIKKLDSDFEKEARLVLDQAQKLPIKKEGHVRICKEIINAINRWPASSSSRFADQAKTRCEEVSKEDR